ncbi:hypothetical protein LGK95_07635 [Clostridium algoriphilum]|uniref:hypothetical protein n=1 Tax=Clostridium algoriphilum TaxID=198347 RepID=UPI001CF4602E|nr:hypothetical protein [Clostridium algoriphilum]MCB2293391.1 hypothetical protein [Clostridium algoriphilum]
MKIKPYRALLGFMIIIIFMSACGQKETKNNLIIGNKSSEIISNIAVQRVGKTDVMGSNLKHNEHCYFDMGVQENCTYIVEFEDANNKSIHSKKITSNFNENDIVNINIFKDDKGKWSIILENQNK